MLFNDLEEAVIQRIKIHDSRHVTMAEKYAKLSPKHLARVKDITVTNVRRIIMISVDSFVKKEEPRQIPAAESAISETVM